MIANKVWALNECCDDRWYDNEDGDMVDFVDLSRLDSFSIKSTLHGEL